MSDKYILDADGRTAIAVDWLAWARWFEAAAADRIVARTIIGDATVSTVFLGLNHQYGDGPPLIFETLVFAGALDGEMERYSTWEEAEQGHQAMVKRVTEAQATDALP
jgi:hypothetical protein